MNVHVAYVLVCLCSVAVKQHQNQFKDLVAQTRARMRKHREKHQQNKSDEKSSSSSSSSSSSLDASEDTNTTPAAAESDMTSADSVASDAVQQTKSEVNDDGTRIENEAIRNSEASSASPETQLSPIFERSFKSPGKLKKREKSDAFPKTRSFQSDSSSTDLFNDDTIEESSTAPNNDDVMPATATAEHSTDDKRRFPEACDDDSQRTISASVSPEKTLPQSQQQYDNEISCSGTMTSQASDLAWLSQRAPEDDSQPPPTAPETTTTQRSAALCDLIDGDVNDDDVSSSCQAAVVTSAAVAGGQGSEIEV